MRPTFPYIKFKNSRPKHVQAPLNFLKHSTSIAEMSTPWSPPSWVSYTRTFVPLPGTFWACNGGNGVLQECLLQNYSQNGAASLFQLMTMMVMLWCCCWSQLSSQYCKSNAKIASILRLVTWSFKPEISCQQPLQAQATWAAQSRHKAYHPDQKCRQICPVQVEDSTISTADNFCTFGS